MGLINWIRKRLTGFDDEVEARRDLRAPAYPLGRTEIHTQPEIDADAQVAHSRARDAQHRLNELPQPTRRRTVPRPAPTATHRRRYDDSGDISVDTSGTNLGLLGGAAIVDTTPAPEPERHHHTSHDPGPTHTSHDHGGYSGHTSHDGGGSSYDGGSSSSYDSGSSGGGDSSGW